MPNALARLAAAAAALMLLRLAAAAAAAVGPADSRLMLEALLYLFAPPQYLMLLRCFVSLRRLTPAVSPSLLLLRLELLPLPLLLLLRALRRRSSSRRRMTWDLRPAAVVGAAPLLRRRSGRDVRLAGLLLLLSLSSSLSLLLLLLLLLLALALLGSEPAWQQRK
jgi:hypothetical protein